jgi:allophanate hydrolase subunit 2
MNKEKNDVVIPVILAIFFIGLIVVIAVTGSSRSTQTIASIGTVNGKYLSPDDHHPMVSVSVDGRHKRIAVSYDMYAVIAVGDVLEIVECNKKAYIQRRVEDN